jgi:two-component system cell cycle sensor histidine kinase/response regulator CckA
MNHEPSHRILVVDASPAIYQQICNILAGDNPGALKAQPATVPAPEAILAPAPVSFEVDHARDSAEGLASVTRAQTDGRPYAVVFIDVTALPQGGGLDTIKRLLEADPAVEVVLCTDATNSPSREAINQLGRTDRLLLLKKPLDSMEVRQACASLAEKWSLGRQVRAQVQFLERIVRERTRALQRSLSLLQATLDATPDGILVADLDGHALSFNEVLLKMWNIPLSKLDGCDPNDEQELAPILRQLSDPGAFLQIVRDSRSHPDRETSGLLDFEDGREFEHCSRPQRVAGEIVGRVWTFRDLTQRKRAEEALKASEAQFRLLFENNPSPIYVYDKESLAFLAANEAALRHYGYSREEFLALTLRDIALAEEVPAFLDQLNQLSQTTENAIPGNSGIWRHRKKSGLLGEVEITSHALAMAGRPAWLSLGIDVTERLSLEAQLRQSQKMESVGQLAGGIAHDFNNLLTVINGHTGLLMAGEPLSPKVLDRVREISEAARRAAELTRQLLAFSRKQELHPQVVDLNEVVNNVTKMLRRILGEDIALESNFAPNLPPVKADLGMIEQVLLNLAVNSRDAMPRGGRLNITTSSAMIDAAYVQHNPEAVPGRAVCLGFGDTGSGISPENLPRIFEPFFTTKELDRGTGLGLATVYGIVKQHQGWIKVASKLNEGTTFQIFLPACNQRPGEAILSAPTLRVIGGTETILVVEDEAPLRKLIQHILESYGYKVLEAANGNAALEVWQDHRSKIDLLLSDLILPDGMSGPELAQLLQKSKPALKVIFTSGYDTQKLAKDYTLAPGTNFIQKPFHARKLAETVHDCLSALATAAKPAAKG